ncbi:MAG: rod shape-determining protein MreC [candidate division WOR-3 bacterium]|nr:rod shape-determining protein MreC [candidate division WOR-3 bacterium]
MNKKNRILFFILILLSILIFVINLNIDFTVLRNIARAPILPFTKSVEFMDDIIGYRSQKKQMLKEIAEKKLDSRRMAALAQENRELRNILKLRENIRYDIIVAEVIGGDYTDGDILIIDKGSRSGIDVNMPVMYMSGILGKVEKIDRNSAYITTYNDIDFRISLKHASGFVAIARSSKRGKLVIYGVKRAVPLSLNDTLYSSGMGKLYPAGIPFGIIDMIENSDENYKSVYIDPLESIADKRFIFVIMQDSDRTLDRNINHNSETVGYLGWFRIKRTH